MVIFWLLVSSTKSKRVLISIEQKAMVPLVYTTSSWFSTLLLHMGQVLISMVVSQGSTQTLWKAWEQGSTLSPSPSSYSLRQMAHTFSWWRSSSAAVNGRGILSRAAGSSGPGDGAPTPTWGRA